MRTLFIFYIVNLAILKNKGETMKQDKELTYEQYAEEFTILSFDEWKKQGGC